MLISSDKISPYIVGNLFFFDVVCRHLSFSKAAEELNVTQAAISQRMRQLEEQLGCQLFHRHARGVSLTKTGETLHNGIQDSFAAICSTVTGLTSSQARNDLAISCPPSLAMDWLIPRLDDFYALHPDIKLKISAEYNTPTRDFFQRNNIDIALRYEPSVSHHGLNSENIAEEEIVPVCTPAYRDETAQPRNISAALSGLPLLHDGEAWDGAPNDYEWSFWAQQQGINTLNSPQEKFFNLAQLAVKAALQGQGIAMGRAAIVLDYLTRGELKMVYGRPAASGLWYRIITLKNADETDPIIRFKRWFRAQMRYSLQEFHHFLENNPSP